ncbi:MAG: hypothetical protein LBL76_06540 [Treponema sp.]|jgi:hypothetical protein|nr:hypothetical protein [Treponema sp.]
MENLYEIRVEGSVGFTVYSRNYYNGIRLMVNNKRCDVAKTIVQPCLIGILIATLCLLIDVSAQVNRGIWFILIRYAGMVIPFINIDMFSQLVFDLVKFLIIAGLFLGNAVYITCVLKWRKIYN